MSDPCDFLTPRVVGAEAPELRRRLLDGTLGLLRRRRWLRRAGVAAVLAVCYGAGALTMHWLRPTVPVAANDRPQQSRPVDPVDASRPPERPAPSRPDPDPVRVLVKAADHVLVDQADPLTALHGYTKALDEGGDAALAISTDDSFLMMAIKDARKREKVHAKNLD